MTTYWPEIIILVVLRSDHFLFLFLKQREALKIYKLPFLWPPASTHLTCKAHSILFPMAKKNNDSISVCPARGGLAWSQTTSPLKKIESCPQFYLTQHTHLPAFSETSRSFSGGKHFSGSLKEDRRSSHSSTVPEDLVVSEVWGHYVITMPSLKLFDFKALVSIGAVALPILPPPQLSHGFFTVSWGCFLLQSVITLWVGHIQWCSGVAPRAT